MNQAKIWAIQVSKLAKMEGCTFTPQVFLQHHSAAHTANPRLSRAPLGPQTTHMDRHCAWKAASKSRPLKSSLIMKFDSLFMQLCVIGEKSKLLAWVMIPVFQIQSQITILQRSLPISILAVKSIYYLVEDKTGLEDSRPSFSHYLASSFIEANVASLYTPINKFIQPC